MAKLAIDLTVDQQQQLSEQASRLGLPPEELARAAVVELLARPSEEFAVVANQVLEENAELYRRLA